MSARPATARTRAPGYDRTRFLIVVVLSGVGLGMTAPLTVLFAVGFGASDLLAGVAVSSVGLSLLVVDLFGTRFVPRIDGRAVVWFSLTVFGIGSFVSAAAPSLAVMVAARVFQGIGAAVFMGGALQVVVRFAPPAESGRAIGAFNAAWFTGVAVGPFIGGFLASHGDGQAGYRLAFAVCGVVCLVVALAARLGLPSIPSARRPEVTRPRRAHARPGLRLWPPLALSSLGQAVRGGLAFTVIPLLGTRQLGLSTATVGLALSALAVVDIVSMRAGGALADRVGRRPVLVVAFVVGTAACLAAPWVTGALGYASWCAVLGVTVGIAWVVPAATVVDVAVDPEAGLATYRIAADVGQLAGSTGAGGLVGAVGPVGAAVAIGVGFGATAIWTGRLPETARVPAPVELAELETA